MWNSIARELNSLNKFITVSMKVQNSIEYSIITNRVICTVKLPGFWIVAAAIIITLHKRCPRIVVALEQWL